MARCSAEALLDRARYLRAVAEAAHDTHLPKLAEDLITAHTATVDWLSTPRRAACW